MPKRVRVGVFTTTPGPWEVQRVSEAFGSGARVIDDFMIMKPQGGIGGGPAIIAWLRCEANAYLIAAAPDLLEALKTADKWLEAGAPATARESIRAAIAKVEAKS
jgi:hypothetical protein